MMNHQKHLLIEKKVIRFYLRLLIGFAKRIFQNLETLKGEKELNFHNAD
jgi:hypothetical protein